jgi:hypothetical protein
MKAVLPSCLIAAWLVPSGCGRWDFSSQIDASDSSRPTDAPGLPASLACRYTQVTIPSVAAGGELAVYRSKLGYDVAWADGGAVTGVALDAQLAPGAIAQIIPTRAQGVAGLVETQSNVLVVTTNALGQDLWSLAQDLTAAKHLRTDLGLASRAPFASDLQLAPRVWVRGTPTAVVASYIHDTGVVDADGTFATQGPVTSMSAEDGPDHSHIAWTEDLGGGRSRCLASDIRYAMPTPPTPTGTPQVLSSDCFDVRAESGPPAADSMIVVWQTKAHLIEARYLASTGDIMHDMSLHGRAPKVRFDGTEFWISWIEEGSRDELHLASFDLAGNVKEVALPGWTPVGDEAFELVRRGATVYLVVLSTDTLNFLLTCA